jgi:hypothetical protein
MKYRIIALTAAAAFGLAGAAYAQGARPLSAHLMGSNEKPNPGAPNGMGHATVKIDQAKNQLCYTLMVEGLGTVTMAHIHKGGPDVAGPVAVPLTAPDASGKASGCATVDAKVLKDIADNPGNYYVNVHTAEFRAGAARGQLSK